MRRSLYLVLPLALLVLAVSFAGTAPKAILTYPTAGAVFHPGQQVNITWVVQDPGSQKFCEQEIFMTVNGTRYRISPELEAKARNYTWFVPNIGGQAIIDLHLGCGRGTPWEASFPQPNNKFSIMTLR